MYLYKCICTLIFYCICMCIFTCIVTLAPSWPAVHLILRQQAGQTSSHDFITSLTTLAADNNRDWIGNGSCQIYLVCARSLVLLKLFILCCLLLALRNNQHNACTGPQDMEMVDMDFYLLNLIFWIRIGGEKFILLGPFLSTYIIKPCSRVDQDHLHSVILSSNSADW